MHRPWPLKEIAAAALRASALLLAAGNACAQYAISQSPPMSLTPPTNIVMMLDDSGSMQWAYVPDAYGACTGTRRFNAGTFNALAYNPAIEYDPPPVITSSAYNPSNVVTATGIPTLSTSFKVAYIDGFNPGQGAIDLSTSYQPTASYQPGGTSQTYSPHPSQDLTLIGVTSASGGGGGGGGGTSSCGSTTNPTGGNGGGNQFGPGSGSDTVVGAAAYYYVYDSTQTGCPAPAGSTLSDPGAQPNNDNCYRYTAVTASSAPASAIAKGIDGLQNFANWYSFYRTRHLMIASAAASAMYDSTLTGARMTWRALNSCQDMVTGTNCAGWDGYNVDNRLRTFNDVPAVVGQPAQRGSFYEWLAHLPADQPTPTRSTWTYIGDYFSQGPNTAFSGNSLGVNGPYGLNPNQPTTDANSGEVACVQNYDITLTDGQWNQDSQTAGAYFGAADTQAITLGDGKTQYPPPAPPAAVSPATHTAWSAKLYGNDPNADTLSDIAFHYWATNLRPDLSASATAVKPYYLPGTASPPTTADYWNPQNDPATWPHVVQMTIGVGMTSSMNTPNLPWWGNTSSTQYQLTSATNTSITSVGYSNLWDGTLAWPAINNGVMQGDTGKPYDLWHAALNSRGLAFSAESPADLVAAMQKSLARAKVTLIAQSAVATASTSLNNGTVVYLASYNSADWHGTMAAYGIASNGTINPNCNWTTDSTSTTAGCTIGTFAAAGTRSIITSDTQGTSTTASVASGIQVLTTDTRFNTIWQLAPGITPANSSGILGWVRGDATQEKRNGGQYRDRPVSVLGDIVDSAPIFTFRENFGYAALPEGMSATPNYQAFLQGVKNAGTGNIYTGQGMLYVGGNDGMLHGFDAGTGNEVFAYVPHDVINNLPALADPGYAHRFYVDQTPYVGDAYFCFGPSGCSWKTVAVGTTGAGGQGVFALDVTAPQNLENGGSAAANNVLWDLDGQGPTDPKGDPDLGYPIGRPMVARLNDGSWAAIFGNGYLSTNGCAVLYIVRLDTGAITRISTSGGAGGSSCLTLNPNDANGLGPVTLFDADGNMTTDYVYAGDLKGNMWKFDLTGASSGTWKVGLGGSPLFTAPGGSACPPAKTSTAASTCQSITSAPALGPALTGLTGTMVYFGTGRMFAIGDGLTTNTQAFYAILDQNTPVSGGLSQLVTQTITPSGATRTVSKNPVAPPSMGWYMNLPTAGERVTISPVLVGGYVVFATDIPSSSPCTSGGTGWIMAVSASTAPGGMNGFFAATPGVNGVQSTVGVAEGISVMSSTNGPTLLVGGTQGVQNIQSNPNKPKGRISWHELVR